MKKFLKLKENSNGYTHIDAHTGYDKNKKHYYLMLAPVKYDEKSGFITVELYKDVKIISLLDVKRASNGAQAQAEKIAIDDFEIYLHHLLRCKNLMLEEN